MINENAARNRRAVAGALTEGDEAVTIAEKIYYGTIAVLLIPAAILIIGCGAIAWMGCINAFRDERKRNADH